jgi:hypothetical protein
MVTTLPSRVALGLVNVMLPKFARGAMLLFTVGLSTIHSAVSLEES